MSTKEESSYFAFISYKSEDSEWAIWLQHELTHYHLPASYNGRKNIRKNLRPVFRDLDELSAGNLREQIHKALKNSQNLIVICSPKSAKSKWVNDEIETFISLGRTDRIFPFIVDGSNPESFFPPALLALPKDKERLGGDVRLSGKDAAFVKVVAGMLGLRFSSLWNKYEIEKAEEQRKIREQRDNLYKVQSRYLAEKAGNETANDNSFLARRLAFSALPSPGDIDGRPFVAEAEKALRESFLNDSFKISIPLQSHSRARLVTSRYRREVLLFSSAELYVVDPASGKILRYFTRPNSYSYHETDEYWKNSFFENGAISPDGKLLATVHRNKVCRVWDMGTGEILATIQAVFDYEEFGKVFPDFDPYDEDNRDSIGMDTVPQPIACVRFSPDGKTLAISSYNCTLWDTQTFQKVKSLYSPQPFAGDIDISPDGRYISSPLGFWSIKTGEWTDYNLPFQDGDRPLCQFSQDGKRVGVIVSPHIFVVDFESGTIINELQSQSPSLKDAVFSSDIEYLFFNNHHSVLLLNLASKEEDEIISESIRCFCIDEPSHGFVVYTTESILSFRSAVTDVEELALPIPDDNKHLLIAAMHYPFIAYTYCVSMDDGIINSGDMTEIAVYDISTGMVRCFLEGLRYRTDKMAFSSDLEYLTAIDNEFLLWKIPTANDSGEPPIVKPCNRFPLAEGHITSMLPLNGGKGIIYAASFVLGLNDGKNTVRIETPEENDSKIPYGWHNRSKKANPFIFSDDDFGSGREVYYATTLGMSPDGAHLLAAYNDSYLRVWDYHTRKLIKRIYLNGEEACSIEYSPDGQYVLVTLMNGSVSVFNAQDNFIEVLTVTLAHDINRLELLFHPFISSFDWANNRILFLYPNYDDENHLSTASGALAFPPLEGLLDRVKKQFGEVTFSDEEKKKYLLD